MPLDLSCLINLELETLLRAERACISYYILTHATKRIIMRDHYRQQVLKIYKGWAYIILGILKNDIFN